MLFVRNLPFIKANFPSILQTVTQFWCISLKEVCNAEFTKSFIFSFLQINSNQLDFTVECIHFKNFAFFTVFQYFTECMILSALISLHIFCLNTSDDRKLIIYKPDTIWVFVYGYDELMTTPTKTNRQHWTDQGLISNAVALGMIFNLFEPQFHSL